MVVLQKFHSRELTFYDAFSHSKGSTFLVLKKSMFLLLPTITVDISQPLMKFAAEPQLTASNVNVTKTLKS